MRKLLLIGQGSVLALMVLAIAACSIGLAAGPPGAVEIKRGAPIEIRALLSESVVPSVSPLIGTAMELAIKDYGPIHRAPCFRPNSRREVLWPGRARGGRGRCCRRGGRRRHRDLMLRCGGGGIADPQCGRSLDDIAGKHVAFAHIRSRRECRPAPPRRLLPRYG